MKTVIDWSKSPKNCIGYSVSSAKNNYWITEDELTIGAPDYGMLEVKFTPNPNIKPVTVPTFTQEMAGNRLLPIAGMECLLYSKIEPDSEPEVTIDFINDNGALIRYKDSGLNNWITDYHRFGFKPLTPSDTEKAIDEACKIIDGSDRCKTTNVNIDCSAAQKAVIITMIERGYTKGKS